MKDLNLPILSLREISYRYSGNPNKVVNNFNCDIYDREIIAIVGRSGSGKTTLLELISGIIEADTGSKLYYGKPVRGRVPNTSIIMQECVLFDWMTVSENIALGYPGNESNIMQSNTMQNTIDKLLKMVSLQGYAYAYPHSLSGGMRQRVSIARALISQPSIIFMDEPFGALDSITAESIWDDLENSNSTIVLVTHSIEEAALHANRVLAIGGGEIIEMEINNSRRKYGVNNVNEADSIIDQIFSNIYFLANKDNVFDYFPLVEVTDLISVLDSLNDVLIETQKTKIDLVDFAEYLELEGEALFEFIDPLSALKFIYVEEGDIVITRLGSEFLQGDREERPLMFAKAFKKYIPFTYKIIGFLNLHKTASITQLLHLMGNKSNEENVRSFINWARYAKIIEYNDKTDKASLL